MAKKTPVTPAIRVLRDAGVTFEVFVYDYSTYPGALGAAEFIGIDPHLTAKTIVFVTDEGEGVVVLMHGDLEVSTKKLARSLGVKRVAPADQRTATRITGYRFGGTSPLGMRSNPPVLAQQSLSSLEHIYVNVGRQGMVAAIASEELLRLTRARLDDVAAG